MKRDINKLLWPYMSITMYNEINSVCVYVIAADCFIIQDCITNKFGLPHATYMCNAWHLFDSNLAKCFGLEIFRLIKPYLQNMCYSKT